METQTIITDKMVFGGDCISKIDGKTVFVPYALPGEELEVEITADTPDYSRATIKKIIKPSSMRIMPFCPLYTKCGGCNMQHVSYENQVELRKAVLKDTFKREGVEVPEIEVIKASDKGYRTRFQFHDGGLMGRKSNDIVQVNFCPCANAEINKFLKEIPFNERPKGRVNVFGSEKITSIPQGFDKIIIATENPVLKKINKKMPEYSPNGRKLKKQRKVREMYAGSTGSPENFCTVNIAGKSISFDVQGFFQSNLDVLEKTIPVMLEGLSGKNVLDMYAGCGTFSVFLADYFEKICLVEHNKSALVYAEQNLAGKKHESFGLSGQVWVKYHAENYIKSNGTFDAVVIDPPRSGMEKEVCQWIRESGIPHVRSLSCDPSTHARDSAFMVKSGYRLTKLYLLDFYPQTGHIESLAFFEK